RWGGRGTGMWTPARTRRAVAAVLLALGLATPAAALPTTVRWVTGYYAAYSDLGPPFMHPADLNYAGLTHVIHWPVVPLANGTFHPDTYGLTAAQSTQVISLAHAAGTKVILGFGGDAATVGAG